MKSKKDIKRICKLKNIDEEKIDKLYKLSPSCKGCKFGCIGEFMGKECKNKEVEYSLNELIDLLKEHDVNLNNFCDKYELKLDMLMEMLKAKIPLKYSYYIAVMQRIRNPKYNSLEREFLECSDRFMDKEENEVENNTSKCEEQ